VARADGDETRARILEVALPLFADHGFAGTSVRDVARAAGVNVATLAYHFRDKQGLYDEVVTRLHHDLAADLAGGAMTVADADPVVGWLRHGWRFCRAHRDHLRLLLRHVLDTGAQAQVVLDRWSEPLLAVAEDRLRLVHPDWTPTRRRLLVLSLMHLMVRLSLESPAQLARMAALPEDRAEDELVAWFAHLARAG
jgi:AcrR family transcriptional regulator